MNLLDAEGVHRTAAVRATSLERSFVTANLLGLKYANSDTVARVSSDDFAILLPSFADNHDAISVAQRVLSELAVPFEVDQHELYVTASIGVALNTGSYGDAEELMRDADIALRETPRKAALHRLRTGHAG